MRKSPYKHKVTQHTRNNRPVRQYERGKGAQAILRRKRRVVGNPMSSSSAYDVTVMYINRSEKLRIDAKNFINAMDSGLERRGEIQVPKKVIMRMVK